MAIAIIVVISIIVVGTCIVSMLEKPVDWADWRHGEI